MPLFSLVVVADFGRMVYPLRFWYGCITNFLKTALLNVVGQ